MKRVVLTGASGFVGANLARRLVQEGHEVHLILRHGYKPWRLQSIRDNALLHEVDPGDFQTFCPLLDRIRPDWIFHLAVHGAYASM